MPATTAMATSTKRTRAFVDEDDDCGFKFRRASKGGKRAPAVVEIEVPLADAGRLRETRPANPAPTAPIAGRRLSVFGDVRRSSFFGGSAAPAVRPLPQGVAAGELHKHLLPDLPGPLKMRQLVAWAAQVAGGVCAAAVLDGLASQTINVSWYARPADPAPSAPAARGPKNQELLDAIELYERYSRRLRAEEDEWLRLQADGSARIRTIESGAASGGQEASAPHSLPEDLAAVDGQLRSIGDWLRDVPHTIDGLQWTLAVLGSFEGHSRVFCERVFAQIRGRLFRADAPLPSTLSLFRALADASRS